MADDEHPLMLDLTEFTSPPQALELVRRDNGFDESAREVLSQTVKDAGGITMPIAVTFSAVARARAFYEGAVREIEHDNPQTVFTLIRQFAETLAVIVYTADHPQYVDVLVAPLGQRTAGAPKQERIGTFIQHMDTAGYSTQFGPVYGELSDMTHFGSSALWNPFWVVSDEERRAMWLCRPHWRSDTEMYKACAYLLELAPLMEWGLQKLTQMCHDTVGQFPIAGHPYDPLAE